MAASPLLKQLAHSFSIVYHHTLVTADTLRQINTPGRIRTYDLRIKSPLLYPTELRALICLKISYLSLFLALLH